MAALFVGSRPAAAEDRIALLMGNGAYGELGQLANPVNDAELMARTLNDLGFEVLVRTNLDQAAMKRAIQEFGRRLDQAGSDGIGLFYYAGHGVQVNGVNYLIPLNAHIERESDIEIEAVNADWVLTQMEFAANRLNFLILDACRNNPLTRGFRSATQGLARMDAPRGTLVAYSTAPGSVSMDGAGRNSPYTQALARTITQPGLAAEEVFRRVRVEVLGATDDRQVPWELSSLTAAFYFSQPPAPADGGTAQQAEARPGAPADDDGHKLELAFWEAVRDSRNPAAFGEYLRRFPGGTFAGLARLELDNLSRQQDRADAATREFEVAAIDTVLVTQKRANVRALPTPEAERITTLEPGVAVQATGRVAGRDWYRVQLADGADGFVWAPLLGDTPPPARERPKPAPPDAVDALRNEGRQRAAVRARDIAGRWEGMYRCQQEEIGVILDINSRNGSQVSAVFDFFPLPDTPSFPRGRFAMSGLFGPADGSLQLRGERWIERPWGFQMHNLEGRLDDDGSKLNGRVLTTGCTHFTLTRR